MKTYIILDLDNTIADDSWRIPKINWQRQNPLDRYHDYHSLSAFDKVGNDHLLATRHHILIFTARPVRYRAITEEWLRRNGIEYEHLLMRNDNDHCHSVVLKAKMLNWLPEMYGIAWDKIFAAYDDRKDVVEMFEKCGIAAACVPIHDTCAYTNPNEETA